MLIKFLGTSSVEAIPRKDCECSQCQSKDQRDKRTRSTILIYPERSRGVDDRILIDAGPDIIKQIKNSKIKMQNLNYVIITHRHEDHIGGLKKLKVKSKKLKVIYLDEKQNFPIGDLKFQAFEVPHSKQVKTYGLAVSFQSSVFSLVYAPDFSKINKNLLSAITHSPLAILDGSMLERNFGGHLAIKKQIKILKPYTLDHPIIYYTHNGHTRIPHQQLEKELQKLGGKNIHLAYDGLELYS